MTGINLSLATESYSEAYRLAEQHIRRMEDRGIKYTDDMVANAHLHYRTLLFRRDAKPFMDAIVELARYTLPVWHLHPNGEIERVDDGYTPSQRKILQSLNEQIAHVAQLYGLTWTTPKSPHA